jgi:hypothetical protein
MKVFEQKSNATVSMPAIVSEPWMLVHNQPAARRAQFGFALSARPRIDQLDTKIHKVAGVTSSDQSGLASAPQTLSRTITCERPRAYHGPRLMPTKFRDVFVQADAREAIPHSGA